jgi:broad specificity phosphatase PhoE
MGDLDEVNYGAWTGRTLSSLAEDPLWQRFNRARGATRIPGGETMAEVVTRARRAMETIAAAHPGELLVAVTHGDVLRALLASCLGMDLGDMLRLEVAPASVSVVRFSPDPRVLVVNWAPEVRALL